MVWVPTESAEVVRLAPVPRAPSRLEVHARLAARSPSSSLAVPVKVTGVVSVLLLPSAGAVIATAGDPFTVRVIVLLPAAPRLSVAEAVMVWVPTESAEVVTLAPVPRAPSRSELQARLAVRSPSSGSLALPEKVTAVPVSSVVPSAGAVMETVGVALAFTVTVIWSLPGRPRLSLTAAVIVWVPSESAEVVRPSPVPRAPSRLDVQVRRPIDRRPRRRRCS